MSESGDDPSPVILALCLTDVVVTLVLFVTVIGVTAAAASPGKRLPTRMRLMNALAIVIVLLPLLFVVPHYYIIGRTESECRFLHHWAGSVTFLSGALIQTFFILRSNQIATGAVQTWLGRGLLLVKLALFVIGVVGFNLSLETEIIDDVCIPILNEPFTGLIGYELPFVIEGVVTGRFVWLVTRTMTQTQAATNTASLRRLVRMTCVMSLITLVVDVVMALVTQGVIVIDNPALIPVLIAAESTYTACAVAWPVLIIALVKFCRGARLVSVTTPFSAMSLRRYQSGGGSRSTAGRPGHPTVVTGTHAMAGPGSSIQVQGK